MTFSSQKFKIIRSVDPLQRLNASSSEWTSFTQLVQELVSGVVRRNQFTQWELDLLLDLQISRLRKSSRADALRRYLRVVQQAQINGASEPPKFLKFVEETMPRKAAASGGGSA
jgi:hypothetical protein